MTNQPQQAPPSAKDPRAFLAKILGSSVILLTLVVLALVGGGALGVRLVIHRLEKIDRNQEILATDFKVISEQHAVREIVEAHLSGLSPDQVARIAFEIYDSCHRHMNYPLYIPLGLIAQESSWNPDAHNGDAVGLMQVRPSSAMAHFRALGIAFSPAALKDPVTNVTIGMRILFDCQDAAVLMGWSPVGQYVRGLYDYNGGGEPYARKVLTQSVPYQKALDAPLQDVARKPEPDPTVAPAVAAKPVARPGRHVPVPAS
jgi:hypothetical protein